MIVKRLSLVILVALFTLFSAPAHAQDPDAKITGTVRDGTGVGIPGVTVTATNQKTRASVSGT